MFSNSFWYIATNDHHMMYGGDNHDPANGVERHNSINPSKPFVGSHRTCLQITSGSGSGYADGATLCR